MRQLFKYNKLFYCYGLGSAKNDAQLMQQLAEKNSLQFQMIKYNNEYSKVDEQIWNIESWDITKELQQNQQNKIITVCVSAGAQAFLRAVLYTPILLNQIEGLLLISPGVGMDVNNYINRVFPLKEKELLKSGFSVEHPKTNVFSEEILVNLKSLEDYAQNCVLGHSFPLFNFPVRIVHGIHDKIVPFSNSLELLNKINSNNKAILHANSGHLINEYSIIIRAIDSLLEAVEKNTMSFYNNISILNLIK